MFLFLQERKPHIQNGPGMPQDHLRVHTQPIRLQAFTLVLLSDSTHRCITCFPCVWGKQNWYSSSNDAPNPPHSVLSVLLVSHKPQAKTIQWQLTRFLVGTRCWFYLVIVSAGGKQRHEITQRLARCYFYPRLKGKRIRRKKFFCLSVELMRSG